MTRVIIAAGLVIASLVLRPADACAASITFDFTGTLANSLGGSNTVTGFFTLDTSGSGAVTNFSFTEPVGVFDTSNSTASIELFTPAISPATDFVGLFFHDSHAGNFFELLFQTTLAGFDGSTFYPGQITVVHGVRDSLIICAHSVITTPCSQPYNSLFVSGEATPRDTSVPEPASVTLLGIGAAALVVKRRSRRPHNTNTSI
jgi:hypothetical protein